MKTRVEANLGGQDGTALNGVQFACCNFLLGRVAARPRQQELPAQRHVGPRHAIFDS